MNVHYKLYIPYCDVGPDGLGNDTKQTETKKNRMHNPLTKIITHHHKNAKETRLIFNLRSNLARSMKVTTNKTKPYTKLISPNLLHAFYRAN